ncbi:MAG TPA: threonine-phosphate decarboxylase CobD [Terriglobia bacterium]|nr:threonine-phosphate decarboxylase CobD [Terriglobia bacterium]
MTTMTHGGDVFGAARRLGIPISQLTDFSASINPMGISHRALRRLKRELPLVRHYPDAAQQELRDLIASEEKIDSQCILFGNGATQLLHLLSRWLNPRKALLLAPGFSEYRSALQHLDCKIAEYTLEPEEHFQFKLADLMLCIDEKRPGLVVLANPNNPTGTLVSRSALVELAKCCRDRAIHLVLDESFLDFTSQPSLAPLAARQDYLIVVRSLTKFYALAGLRIGYLVALRPVIHALADCIEPWSVNTLALIAAAESLKDVEYRERTLALVASEREYLSNGLKRLQWLEPFRSQSNFLLAHIKLPGVSGMDLRCALEKDRILVRDSTGFHGLSSQFIRVAVRARRKNQLLLKALRTFGSHFPRET